MKYIVNSGFFVDICWYYIYIWTCAKTAGIPTAAWFIMENPILHQLVCLDRCEIMGFIPWKFIPRDLQSVTHRNPTGSSRSWGFRKRASTVFPKARRVEPLGFIRISGMTGTQEMSCLIMFHHVWSNFGTGFQWLDLVFFHNLFQVAVGTAREIARKLSG